MTPTMSSSRLQLQKELQEERALHTSLTALLQKMSKYAGKMEVMRLYTEWLDPVEKWIKCLENELNEREEGLIPETLGSTEHLRIA